MKNAFYFVAIIFVFTSATARAQVVSQQRLTFGLNGGLRTYTEQAAQASIADDGVTWAFRQKNWSSHYGDASTYQRTLFSERIGNQGSALYAKQEGLETILGARQKTIRQGPDRICLDTRTDTLVVQENKGGGSRLGESYGEPQGTVKNTILSAEAALKMKSISAEESEAYSMVLEYAAKGKLKVEVIRTLHDNGSPERPQVESVDLSSPQSRNAANESIANLSRVRPDLAQIPRLLRVRVETTVGGGANIGIGILLMVDTAGAAHDDLLAVLNPTSRSEAAMLTLGRDGSLFLSGASMTVAGSSSLAGLLTTNEVMLGRLTTLSEWSGRGGFILALGAEGFVIWQYNEGQINARQAGTFSASLLGSIGGGLAGAEAGAAGGAATGAAIGVWFEGVGAAPGALIGGTIGGIAGAFGGGYAGSAFAGWAADSCFQIRDDAWGQKQRADLLQFLSAQYSKN